MKLIHSVDHSGTAGKTGSKFTGNVYNYLTMPATDGITINSVNFTPGARTFWHHHEHGQILQAVLAKDSEQAVLLLQQHYRRTADVIYSDLDGLLG